MNEGTLRLSKALPDIAAELDQRIEDLAGERRAFTLLVFTEGRASYISSCERQESVREMKKLLELWEQGMPDVKAHEVQG